ncbi:GrpB family protein [Salinicoccus albus]|uniref:GrpB family protein n=1 Tax=Salinicoccus albus TaxID=418756 RepID=UPI00037B7BC3|nr:GrpB family protein [Salinicoccus albus]
MNGTTLYKKASQSYVRATLEVLNYFKTDVMEVHHIGSTSLEMMDMPGDIDVLVLVKYERSQTELPEEMAEQGYELVEDTIPYYDSETVLRCSFEGYTVNFILMKYDSARKADILYCRDCINENEKYTLQLQKLKKEFLDANLSHAEYQDKKAEFFLSITEGSEGVEVV